MSPNIGWYKGILFGCLASGAVAAAGESSLDSSRPHVDKLRGESASVKENNFEFPFLISETGVSLSSPASETINKVRAHLKKGMLSIKGSHGTTGALPEKLTRELLPLPSALRQEGQLEAVRECTVEKCLMKLHTAKEKGAVQKSPDKMTAYHQLIVDRVKTYLTAHELLGYEDRDSNDSFIRTMLPNLPFLKAHYASVEKYFREDFWGKKKPPASSQGSFLRQEVVIIAPERLQPIWRIGEVFEFRESFGHLFFELHLYSNHYFDSSLRIYEIIPSGQKSILVITDVIEIDELTKSSLIRMLYLGKMKTAVSTVQNEDIQRIFE